MTDHDAETTRGYRSVFAKNVLQKSACTREKSDLDNQMRALKQQRSREEREVKQQLSKLRETQKYLSGTEIQDDGRLIEDVANINDFTEEDFTQQEEEPLINPYPVVITTALFSTSPDKPGSPTSPLRGSDINHQAIVRRKARSQRELRELGSLNSLVRSHTSGSHVVLPPIGGPSREGSTVSRLGSDVSRLGDQRAEWLGDPGAISSIRRPRRTIAQQRIDHISARNGSETASTTSSFMSMARSMNNCNLSASFGGRGSLKVFSPSDRPMLRASSLKDRCKRTKQIYEHAKSPCSSSAGSSKGSHGDGSPTDGTPTSPRSLSPGSRQCLSRASSLKEKHSRHPLSLSDNSPTFNRSSSGLIEPLTRASSLKERKISHTGVFERPVVTKIAFADTKLANKSMYRRRRLHSANDDCRELTGVDQALEVESKPAVQDI
ncbi:unnamed protein product [Owenia fusiformis]|uniref:Uncharacterized protein n=1 Tax=Owenia fusiformis TaxID=6347 RepID=A0A8S4N213_OWEFU|nr:unnamed protein product [Owenia fusiformis]